MKNKAYELANEGGVSSSGWYQIYKNDLDSIL